MTDERTLVLLHAFPLGAGMWRPQQSAFPGWRVVTPVLPGFDGNDTEASSMEDFAMHVNQGLDRLDIGHAVIGGLSLGGYVAFGVLRQRPERASALILADTRAGADSAPAREGRLRMLQLLKEHGPSGVFEEMRAKLFCATTQQVTTDAVFRCNPGVGGRRPRSEVRFTTEPERQRDGSGRDRRASYSARRASSRRS